MQKILPWFSKNRHVLRILLMFSVLLRISAALFLGDKVEILPGTYDQVSYHTLALRILDGHGFTFGEAWWPLTEANAPTSHWSFLYTFYLVVVYAIFGPHPLAARLIQAVIVGLLQPWLTYLIARRIFGHLTALAATALTSIYIYFVYYAGTLMTEPFYITAILGALYISILMVDHAAHFDPSRFRSTGYALAIGLGLTLGIAILLRQLFLLIVPFIFLWVWWAVRQRSGNRIIPTLLISAFLIVAMILPFTLDNYNRFGRFVLLNTNAGYAFFWGNHPIYGTHFESILPPEMGSYQSLIPDELRNLDEAALDQALLRRGLQFVLDDPIRYFLLSLSRIPEYFKFWPSPQSSTISNLSRMGSFGLFLPFMLYGLYLSLFSTDYQDGDSPSLSPENDETNHRSRIISKSIFYSPIFLLVVFTLLYTAVHIFSWALIRYRLPVDAVLMVFAGLAIVDLARRFISLGQGSRGGSHSPQA